MVEPQPSKLVMRVRFPSPAPPAHARGADPGCLPRRRSCPARGVASRDAHRDPPGLSAACPRPPSRCRWRRRHLPGTHGRRRPADPPSHAAARGQVRHLRPAAAPIRPPPGSTPAPRARCSTPAPRTPRSWTARPCSPRGANRGRRDDLARAVAASIADAPSQVPLVGMSRRPGSFLNRHTRHLSDDLLSQWRIQPARDRGMPGHDLEVVARFPSGARKHVDRATLPSGWSTVRSPGSTRSTLVVHPRAPSTPRQCMRPMPWSRSARPSPGHCHSGACRAEHNYPHPIAPVAQLDRAAAF